MAWSRTAYRLTFPDHDRRHRHASGDRPPPRATRPRPISVRLELDGGTATVYIGGELDLTTTPELARHLEQVQARQPRRLVLDLSEVSFIDVAAARLLSGATGPRPAGATGPRPAAAPPVLRRASPEARRVLALTGFDSLCEFDD
jgi:anti-anti-sigma factor